jgi:hypothetical protein
VSLVEQARRFTYARQRLGRAAPDAATALREVIGVYSSHPSAPLTLHARAAEMDAPAFHALDALRLPAMRGSIHLLPRETAHLPFRALQEPPAQMRRRLKWFGVEEADFDRLRDAVVAAAPEPRSLAEIREATGEDADAVKGTTAALTRTGEMIRVGAPGLRSNALRYVAASIPEADPAQALRWLVGEYLRAFGPATREDVRWWTGGAARPVAGALAAFELEEVGDGLMLRAEDREAFAAAPEVPADAVDLLPKWDMYTMGHAPKGRDRFADPGVVDRCYDFRGDGVPVVLVGGRAAATWALKAGKGVAFEVDWFERATKPVQRALDERLDEVRALLAT